MFKAGIVGFRKKLLSNVDRKPNLFVKSIFYNPTKISF